MAFDLDLADQRTAARHTADRAALNRWREERMARHIRDRILDRDPAARVVVWAGHQHAMKAAPAGLPLPGPFMAEHLWRLTGAEPFCVYQCSPATWSNGLYSLWRQGALAEWRGRVAVLRAACQAPEVAQRIRALGVDAVILHPPGGGEVLPDGGTVAVTITTAGSLPQPLLVQALPVATAPAAWHQRARRLWGPSLRAARAVLLAALLDWLGVEETPVAQALTDPAGECRLHVPPGTYRLQVKGLVRRERRLAGPLVVSVGAGETASVRFELQAPGG